MASFCRIAHSSSVSSADTSTTSSKLNNVVSGSSVVINERFLNAETELRQKFGNAVINEANQNRASSMRQLFEGAVNATASTQRQSAARAAVLRKRCKLVTIRAQWPKNESGLGMRLEGWPALATLH